MKWLVGVLLASCLFACGGAPEMEKGGERSGEAFASQVNGSNWCRAADLTTPYLVMQMGPDGITPTGNLTYGKYADNRTDTCVKSGLIYLDNIHDGPSGTNYALGDYHSAYSANTFSPARTAWCTANNDVSVNAQIYILNGGSTIQVAGAQYVKCQ